MNDQTALKGRTTQRVLRPYSSWYLVMGLAFGFVEVSLVLLFIKAGNELDYLGTILVATPIPIIYIAICLFVFNQKIIVGPDYLAYKRFGWSARTIYFKDITKSREHAIPAGGFLVPVLDVYTCDAKQSALQIPSGAFKRSDIKWLTSLPEMKCH